MADSTTSPKQYLGGCTCGAIRYRFEDAPLSLTACHCTECQRSTGSAFGMSLLLMKSEFTLLQGVPETYTVTFPDDGRKKFAKFCGRCGARVWTEFTKFAHVMNLKPGTLDETRWLEPVAHIWVRSAQPWIRIPDGALVFEAQPPDDLALVRAWKARKKLSAAR